MSTYEKNWAMICHLASFAGFTSIPCANVLGPLIVWLIKKDESEFIDDQGRESLNFQISISLYLIICIPLCFIFIGILFMIFIGITALILTIIAAVKANDGIYYRYPMTIRFIK